VTQGKYNLPDIKLKGKWSVKSCIFAVDIQEIKDETVIQDGFERIKPGHQRLTAQHAIIEQSLWPFKLMGEMALQVVISGLDRLIRTARTIMMK
jgi:hypothetical protein